MNRMNPINRREAIATGLMTAAAISSRSFGQTASADRVLPGDGSIASDPKEIVNLWPGMPPGGTGLTLVNRVADRSNDPAHPDRYTDHIGTPSLTVFRPERPEGGAVIIAPGGGYVREVLDAEGFETARRLNSVGVTAFVLRYRLPGEGWANRANVPLQDAQRAMRLVRSNAVRFGIDPARLGFMGFSAGGHVAASLATGANVRVYDPVDAVDSADAHAKFSILLYPVITMGAGAHGGSRDNLLGKNPSPEQIVAYSCERTVYRDAPPTFICLAADDRTVLPAPNGIAMFNALRDTLIPAELHVFEEGGHGFGIAKIAGKPGAEWPNLLVSWARKNGFFKS